MISNVGEYGIAGLVAALAFAAIQLTREAVAKYTRKPNGNGSKFPGRGMPACMYDKDHLKTVDETHKTLLQIAETIRVEGYGFDKTDRQNFQDLMNRLTACIDLTKDTNRALDLVMSELRRRETKARN